MTCLGEIDAWSAANSNHLPIVVLIELKSLSVPEAAAEEGLELDIDLPWAVPVETTSEVLRALDDEVRSVRRPGRPWPRCSGVGRLPDPHPHRLADR